jgi:tetraprenyl-beta-curcumene synthase
LHQGTAITRATTRGARGVATCSTFAEVITFYALVALPLARREHARWRDRAQRIADPALRERASTTLQEDQTLTDGAAAIAVLRPAAANRLVPLLVAYQVLFDLVDTLLERPTRVAGDRDSLRAVLEAALTYRPPGAPTAGALAMANDGFLRDLVEACRRGCATLPRYSEAEPALRRVAARSGDALLVTNNPPETTAEALTAWSRRHPMEDTGLEAAELCAAAHSPLAAHALLASAARPRGRAGEFEAIEAAYHPWICALSTLFDSLVDYEVDARTGDFNFLAQYSSPSKARERFRLIAERALRATRTLPAAHRHAVLTCSLVGMYLASPSARALRVRSLADPVLAVSAPVSSWTRLVVRAQQRLLPSA